MSKPKSPSWRLVDADSIARENKYTFYKPSRAVIAQVQPGELVKLIFAFDSDDPAAPNAERMWVKVTQVGIDKFIGELDNDPLHIKDLACGDTLSFGPCHIINTEHDDSDNLVERYISRCFVTRRVLEGEDPPGYLYREEPDNERDSGWRILAGNETEEFLADPDNLTFVSLGAVLRTNDSFVDFLDSPVGSAFVFDEKSGGFVSVADES